MSKSIDFGLKTPSTIVKLDAREGGLKIRNGAGDDVTFKTARLIMALDNLEVGWAQFRSGVGVVLQGTASDASPGEDWKLAVRVMVEGRQDVPELGGPIGIGEICSTAFVVRQAFAQLHNEQYAPVKDDHPGERPVVEVSDWRVVTMANGTAYQPVMRIVGWIDKEKKAAEKGDLESLLV